MERNELVVDIMSWDMTKVLDTENTGGGSYIGFRNIGSALRILRRYRKDIPSSGSVGNE